MKYKDLILSNFMIRKNKKQKAAFIDKVQEIINDKGLDVTIEKGSFGVRNIVVGDINKAKVVFTAHYDTCAVLPFPNFTCILTTSLLSHIGYFKHGSKKGELSITFLNALEYSSIYLVPINPPNECANKYNSLSLSFLTISSINL